MKIYFNLFFAATVIYASVAGADTTLVYKLTGTQGEEIEHTYNIRVRFMRVDSNAESQPYSLILDAGFMIMHVVDDDKKVFSTYGESPYHQDRKMPEKSGHDANLKQVARKPVVAPILKPTGKKDTVAGVRCMIVNEIVNDMPVAEHCMADAYALGMTPREVITMARLIDFSKAWTDPDWIAVQSNEKYISIRSRPAGGDVTFMLEAVSHETASRDYFRVPPEYQKLDSKDGHTGIITGKK